MMCLKQALFARTHAASLFTPPLNSHVGNALLNTAPDLNQPLFHFINAVDVCLVNTFLK